MQKRYWAHWALMFFGALLVLGGAAGFLWYLALNGMLRAGWQQFAIDQTNAAFQWAADNEDALKFFGTLLGAIFTVGSGALALFKSWHYAEINLPQRLLDTIEENKSEHDRGRLIQQAKPDIKDPGFLANPPAKSVFARLRASFSSPDNEARLHARSKDDLIKQADVIRSAGREANARLATALLIRAEHFEAMGNLATAFAECDAAARACPDDVEVLDRAAAAARRANRDERELELLEALEEQSDNTGARDVFARAMRRRAELLMRTPDESNWKVASSLLAEAAHILGSIADPSDDINIEIGRNRCLFCEVQTKRGATRRLENPFDRAMRMLAGRPLEHAPGEDGGEMYGEDRVRRAREDYEAREQEVDD